MSLTILFAAVVVPLVLPNWLQGDKLGRVIIGFFAVMASGTRSWALASDPEMISKALDGMQELTRGNMTIICVTHEMGFAREVVAK